MTEDDQNTIEPGEQSDAGGAGRSRVVLIAAALFALAAFGVVAFLLSSRNSDSEPNLPDAPTEIDLAAPLYPDGSTENLIHLVAAPVHAGENTIEVRLTQGGERGDPLDIPLEGVDLTLAPLDNADAGRSMALLPAGTGVYRVEEPIDLTDGWWELTATIYPDGENARSTIFYLMLPDPNLNATDNDAADGDAQAKAFFDAGLAQIAATHSIKFIERLTSGEGAASVAQREVTEGGDGAPAASHSIYAQFELLTIGDRTFQRVPGGQWFEREYLPVYPFSAWVELYEGAINFQMAESVMVNGRTTQIITFFVPAAETLNPAWYAWWVDAETGYVIREAMVSTWHYMIYEFGEFNQPLSFDVPVEAASPVASPVD